MLALTETRLNNNTIVNIDLPNYKFYHVNSPTAGIYVSHNLKLIPTLDISFYIDLVESCWIEIVRGIKSKKRYGAF